MNRTQKGGKIIPWSQLQEVILLRYQYYTKRSTGSMPTYQNHNSIFCINRKIHPKIHMGSQRNPNSQSWKRRTKVKVPHFLISEHSYSNQNSVVGTSNKRAKHINEVEQRTQESALMYMVTGSSHKGFKTTEQGKDSLFNIWCWENWTSMCKTMNLDLYFISWTKINS